MTLTADLEGDSYRQAMSEISPLPNHIAIIMDSYGKWAKQRRLPGLEGYGGGLNNVHRMVKCLNRYAIQYITLYDFSVGKALLPYSRRQRQFGGL